MTHFKRWMAILLATFGGYLGNVTLNTDVLAQTRFTPEPRVWDTPNNEISDTPTDPSIYFMVAGPMGGYHNDDLDPIRWRLALSCAEIYCGIEFDYIEHQQEYEGLPRIVANYWLHGADIAPLIGTDSDFLHDIHFVAWEDWNRVLLREGDRYFRIHINPDQSFTVNAIP